MFIGCFKGTSLSTEGPSIPERGLAAFERGAAFSRKPLPTASNLST